MTKRTFPGLLALPTFLILTSCGSIFPDATRNRQADKPVPVSPPQTAQPSRQPETEQLRLAAARHNIAPLLSSENFSGALKVAREEVGQGLTEKSLAKEYLAALNGSISQAEILEEKASYQKAGVLYREILSAFPRDSDLISRADRTPEQVMAGIDVCAEKLMAQGLEAYRSGNLNQAIGIWKGILAFHPQFDPAKTATDTAERQLNNLKSIEEQQRVEGRK